jgi:hypothetical protein
VIAPRLLISTFLASLGFVHPLAAQSQAEIRSAFKNLRSDHIKYNCGRATDWLFAHREALKDQMVQELYVTDSQGRDALLHVLFNTESFAADERFRRLVIARLAEEDTVVGLNDILTTSSKRFPTIRAHWEAWDYIDHHFQEFEPLLINLIPKTKSMFVLWGTTWLLAKHDVLKKNLNLYSDEVMLRIANNLKSDDIPYNAGQAARTFLLLGNQSIPTLQRSARSSDKQMGNFSRALLDAIQFGKHDAFGYLNAQASVTLTPTGEESEPDWLDQATEKHAGQDENTPYP